MRSQFASGREQICPITVNVVSGSFTSAVAGTYYFWLQARNCIGYNLPSTVSSCTVAAGQGIELVFPTDCFRSGENWERFAVTVNTINDASNASLLIEIDATTLTQAPITLPYSITLSSDSHLDIETSTATLPTGMPNGFVLEYTTKGNLYRYSSTSVALPNGDDVIAASPSGNWLAFYETNTFDIYVNDTTSSVLGCDVAIEDLNAQYLIQNYYGVDGSDSKFRRVWLFNDTTVDVAEGERVGVTIDLQGVDVSASFTDLLTLVFEGYVEKTTAELDIYEDDGVTLLPYVGVLQSYTGGKSSSLSIPKTLGTNEAYQLKIYANFTNSDLARNGLIPAYNSTISIIPFIYSNRGVQVGVGAFTGDAILGGDDPNLRRVYPNEGLEVIVDSGSGIVKQFLFENVPSTTVGGLLSNTQDQIISIDGNGSVFTSLSLTANLAQRALVSTLSGQSAYSTLSSVGNGDANSTLNITVTYPTQIRSNYSDVIASSTKGTFFAESIRFYIKRTNLGDSSISFRYFDQGVTPSLASDIYTLTYEDGTTDTAIPTNTPYGLYSPVTPVISSITNTIPAENYTYEVCYCFVYTGTSITNISHSPNDGCIQEISTTLTEVIANSLRYEGAWDSGTAYGAGDVVSHNGMWWIATNTSTGVTPAVGAAQWTNFSNVSYKVKNSTNDTTPGFLSNKLVAGTGITLTTLNSGANESIEINAPPAITVENEGTPLPQRSNINFVGPAVNATDASPDTIVDIRAYNTFTGSPSIVTPTATEQLFVSTDTTPNLLYRSTGTGPGNLSPIGSYRTFTGDPTLVTPTHTGLLYIATDNNKLYRATGTTLGALVEVSGGGSGGGGSDMTYTLTSNATPASGEIKLSSLDALNFGSAGGGFGDTIRISETDGNGVFVGYVLSSVTQGGYVKLTGQDSGAFTYARIFSAVDSGSYRTWGISLLSGGSGEFVPGEAVSVQILPSTAPLYTTKNANFSPGLNSERFFVNVSGGSVTATLPNTGSGPNYDDSLHYLFKVIPGNSNNTLTLARSGSDLIDGSTSVVFYQGESVIVHSDGQGNWYTTGRGQRLVQLQDEGVNQGTAGQATIYNITGEGASVSVSGNTATINIPGGGGLTPVYVTAPTVLGVKGNLYQIAGTTTLNLPAGANGDQIAIVDQLPNFTAAPLTINPNGVQTIAGQSSLVLDSDNACVWLVFYGTNWAIVAAESFTDYSAGGGSASLTSFNTIAVSGQSNIVADSANDTVTFVAGSGISLTTNAATDALTISNTGPLTRTGVYREIWIGAGAMTPRATSGAAIATVETTTNDIAYDTLDFDATTSEGACFQISMPDSWDRGTIKARFYWTATSGSGTVTWAIKGGSLSDDDLLDTAYGTAQSVTDTLIAVNEMHITSATASVTVAGSPALQDWIYFEVSRDIADTLAVDARLIGVKIQYLELTTEPTGW
jgi:hypothetical protein